MLSVDSSVVRISAFQADGPGSIPGERTFAAVGGIRILADSLVLRLQFKGLPSSDGRAQDS